MENDDEGSGLSEFDFSKFDNPYFLNLTISSECMSSAIGEWHFIDQEKYGEGYVLRYKEKEEYGAAYVYLVNSSFMSSGFIFQNGTLQNDVESSRKLTEEQRIKITKVGLEKIVDIMRTNREKFSEIEEDIGNYLREAYELANII